MRLLRLLLALMMMAVPVACEDDAGPKGLADATADVPDIREATDAALGDTTETTHTAETGGGAETSDSAETSDTGAQGAPTEVAPDGPLLAAVVVTPANPSLVPGGSLQMRATAVYIDASTSDVTSQATWTSSRPMVATVSPTGLVSALVTGETTIYATYLGLTGSTSFTATTVGTVGITVTPASASLAHGATRMFTATLAFSNGTSLDITETAQWSIDDPTIASVSNQTGQRGLVQALAAGQTTLRSTITGHTGTATVIVTGH
jgi:uncharacterized protein YjdB